MIKIYGSILCYTFSFKIKTLVLNISLIFLLLGKEHVFNPLNFLNYMFIGHDSSLSIHIHYPVSIHNILWLRFSVRHKVKPFKDLNLILTGGIFITSLQLARDVEEDTHIHQPTALPITILTAIHINLYFDLFNNLFVKTLLKIQTIPYRQL